MSTSDHSASAAAKLSITCTLFRPWLKNTLIGFASIEIAEIGLTIRDVAIHEKGGARWAQLPARPQVRDGALVKGEDGKIEYAKIMEFASRAVRDAFNDAVIRTVLRHTPDAFAGASS